MEAEMKDVQNQAPEHNFPIHRVGITGLKLPIHISDREKGVHNTVATFDVYVDLDGGNKGTHMSRLAIGVQKFIHQQLNSRVLKDICEYIRGKCEAKTAQVLMHFPYFLQKNAPVSKEPGYIHADVTFDMTVHENGQYDFVMKVTSYTTSLCPCSKEISEASAHNQRSKITITLAPHGWAWIEDIMEIAEESSSCEIYSVLKRTDEKYVTEKAYNNPRFVEDMVREIFKRLGDSKKVHAFWSRIEVWNDESIHQHQAYACMDTREMESTGITFIKIEVE
jgi:GTP cyclohydrolase I